MKKKAEPKKAPTNPADADDALAVFYQGLANDVPPAELLQSLRETSTAGYELAEALDRLRQATPAEPAPTPGREDRMQRPGTGPRRGRRRAVELPVMREVIARVVKAWTAELEVKGPGAFASSHEALGVIYQTVGDLEDAIRTKPAQAIDAPTVDLVVAGLHALASRAVGGMEW